MPSAAALLLILLLHYVISLSFFIYFDDWLHCFHSFRFGRFHASISHIEPRY